MENVILVVHLLLALGLIGIVLLQRSEGGGLGMGSGGGGGGMMSSRSAATALGKITWAFAIAFLITSITLTIISAKNSGAGSIIDALGVPQNSDVDETAPTLPDVSDLLPTQEDNQSADDSLTPPRAE